MGLRAFLLGTPIAYRLFQSAVTRNDSITWLVSDFIKPQLSDRILDIGCGTGSILKQLPDVHYFGVDHNPSYIEQAQKVHGDRGVFECLNVDSEDLLKCGEFNAVLLVGVLHHLSDAEVLRLVSRIQKLLLPSGRLITLDTTLVNDQHPFARFLARNDRGRFARSPNHYRMLLETGLRVTQETLRHDLLRIPYSHVAFVCESP